jgi:hypothetical protein
VGPPPSGGHPLATLAVVVVTANHYWLDAAVALALLGATRLVRLPQAHLSPATRRQFARSAIGLAENGSNP